MAREALRLEILGEGVELAVAPEAVADVREDLAFARPVGAASCRADATKGGGTGALRSSSGRGRLGWSRYLW